MLSVVLPAYNGSLLMREAIESILNQTFPKFELIIVDDGSTDDTRDIAQTYAQQDARIQVLDVPHGGICQALNAGIAIARYDWIARMDADDIALPQRFEKQVAAIAAHPNLVVIGTYAHHISVSGKVLSLQKQGPVTEADFNQLRQSGEIPFVIHPTAILRKDIVLKVGQYDSQFAPAEDLELISRMGDYGLVLAVPEPLLLYRVHLQSASMQHYRLQKQMTYFAKTRHKARLAGQAVPTFAEFVQQAQTEPWPWRIRRSLRNLSHFWYRKAGLLWGEAQYGPAGWYLGWAIVLNPVYSLARLWQQKLSPEARQSLQREGQD